MIVIIDYGMGNLRSVQKAFERLNADAIISSDIEQILKADKLILPGVGHFKNGMKKLLQHGLIDVLNNKVIEKKTPIMGICLGMQLFTKHSEEGDLNGLGWFDANTVRFNFSSLNKKIVIPHIGWNTISIKKDSTILKNNSTNDLFYFVHSYYVKCAENNDTLCTTEYGFEFTSVIEKDNIIGIQFHPEKSNKAGLKIIENFIKL